MSRAKSIAAALTLSLSGLAFIGAYEGTAKQVYLDPIGIPTVCTGHTGPEVRLGQVYTAEMCQELLKQDTETARRAVQRLVRVPITQQQFDALVSFTFNVGEGNLAGSTLLKRVNAGRCTEAAQEFLRWDKAGGRVLPGLTKRRKAEAELWRSGC